MIILLVLVSWSSLPPLLAAVTTAVSGGRHEIVRSLNSFFIRSFRPGI